MDDTALKRRFAEELLRHKMQEFPAALAIYPYDTRKAIFLGQRLITDPEVHAIVSELRGEHHPREFMPTKEQAARLVYSWAEHAPEKESLTAKLAAMRLFAEMMGYIEKNTGVTVNNLTNEIGPHVLKYQDFGTDEQWAKSTAEQQARLIADVHKPTHH